MIYLAELSDSMFLIALYIAAGILLQRFCLMDNNLILKLSRLNFRVFMPVTVFSSMWSSDFLHFSPILFLFEGVFVFLLLVVSGLLLRRADPLQKPVFLQGLFRGNIHTFTLAMLPALSPQWQAAALLNASVMAACYNIPSMLLFSQGARGRVLAGKVLGSPVILAAAAGLLMACSGLQQLQVIREFSGGIGALIVPLSFLCTGASLDLTKTFRNFRPVFLCCMARLFLVPIIGFFFAVLLGFSGPQLVLLLPFFASPCGSACHSIACDAGADSSLSSDLVTLSQLAAPLSMFFWTKLLSACLLIG